MRRHVASPGHRFSTRSGFLSLVFLLVSKITVVRIDLMQRKENSRAKSVAIIGASNDRAKFGNKSVRAFRQQGYTVYPVNPKETEIEGLPAYKSILEVPVRPRMVSVYMPPQVLLKILPEIAARGCDELWLNPGAESDEVLAGAGRLGLNVIQACSILGIGLSPAEL